MDRSRQHPLVAFALVATLLAALGGYARPPVAAATSPFTDIAGTTFEADIEWLYNEGITVGCSPTTYCPTVIVTRGQMATFLVRMFDLTEGAHIDAFGDDGSSTHEEDINRLAYAGITQGCTANAFCPTGPVRRDAMASFLVRAIPLTDGAGRNYFRDGRDTTHEDDIDRAAAAGIVAGCYPYLYCPERSVTRGEMAAFLHRVTTPITPPPYPAPTGAQTLHVTVDGTDKANSCLDVAHPCQTVRHGIEASLDYDTIVVGPGTFHEEGLVIDRDVTITGDTASATVIDATGGPEMRIFKVPGTRVGLRHLTLTGGVSIRGAGVMNEGGKVELTNVVITGSHATDTGGAIYSFNGAITITDSTIEGNSAVATGGALYTVQARVTVVRSTVSANTGGDGGAFAIWYGQLTIADSTVTGNTATGRGGAIHGYGKVTLQNTTISGNTGTTGSGGIQLRSTALLYLANSIIAGNTAPANPDVFGPITSQLASIIGVPAGLTLADILDPTGLADNGGPTQTIALTDSAKNPAIDTGDAATCAAVPVDGVDQRGEPRTPPCDIGAYELQP